MPNCHETNSPAVIFEDFGDETILIHLDTGFYYSLDAIGMTLWGLLSQRLPTEDVVARLGEIYVGSAEEIARTTEVFLGKLVDEGLLRACDEPRSLNQLEAAAAPSVSTAQIPFQAPTLTRFEDMEEMLLLDPVHDVTEEGWPMAAPADDAKRDD